jgi:hypothetical protein
MPSVRRDFEKGSFLRIADIGADRSERQLSALHVEMCMAQHLSLSGLTPLAAKMFMKHSSAAASVAVGGD